MALFERGLKDLQFNDEGNLLMQNWAEGAGEGKTLILGEGAVTAGGTTTMYTVPAGKIAYITNSSLSATNKVQNSIREDASIDVVIDGVGYSLLRLTLPSNLSGANLQHAVNQNFPVPIKLKGGDIIRTYSTSIYAFGNCQGWEQDK